MVFSKSFGYAVRGVLYIAFLSDEKDKVQLNEIASRLSVPRHFLAKIMKRMVKAGILSSAKGPLGGFYINENTITTRLLTLLKLTDGDEQFDVCVLQLRKCNAAHPCPLHNKIQSYKSNMQELLRSTTIGDLLKNDNSIFIRSLAAY
jgi:Rrf2 family iron-sulfur cluster assembly transcriptional regulator